MKSFNRARSGKEAPRAEARWSACHREDEAGFGALLSRRSRGSGPAAPPWIGSFPNLLFSWFLSDVQHALVGSVPSGQGPRGPGSAVQRGELRVSRPSGADHRGPGRHALPQSRHQGGAEVSWSTSGEPVSAAQVSSTTSLFPGSTLWSTPTPD